MNGLEYTDLVNEVAEYSDAFDQVAVGQPLLTSEDDFKAVIKVITEATAQYDDGETAICFMGHGTEAESNQVYAKMQEMLTEAGYKNYYVGTVEAAPGLDDVLAMVQAGDYKSVVLEPLMIVAGDHANNDMAGDEEDSWKTTFENAGYEVTCLVRGLGEMEGVQQILWSTPGRLWTVWQSSIVPGSRLAGIRPRRGLSSGEVNKKERWGGRGNVLIALLKVK